MIMFFRLCILLFVGITISAFAQGREPLTARDSILLRKYPNSSTFKFGELFEKGRYYALIATENEKRMTCSLYFYEWNDKWSLRQKFLDLHMIFTTNILMQPFNRDAISDVVLEIGSGGRGANTFGHLFIYQPKKRLLVRIKGFEELPACMYEPENDEILSTAWFNTINRAWYKISGNKLIHLYGIDQERGDNECIRTYYTIRKSKRINTKVEHLKESECDPFQSVDD